MFHFEFEEMWGARDADTYENILEGRPLLYTEDAVTEGKGAGEEEDTDRKIVNVSILRISWNEAKE